VIEGRRLALKRAFGNLVDNAVKYGGGATVTLSDEADAVAVTISDEGPGIAQGDIARALAPFVRLEPARNQETGGFGLGLTIAKAIIEGHQGTLALANGAEGGLCVTVRLPKRQTASA
jgi:signal transduction histidine kinase